MKAQSQMANVYGDTITCTASTIAFSSSQHHDGYGEKQLPLSALYSP